MIVHVRLFAAQRQAAGIGRMAVELGEPATVADAWDAVAAQVPAIQPGRGYVRFARNGTYVDADEPVGDGDEVAFIPPVAGGSGETEADDERGPVPQGRPGAGPAGAAANEAAAGAAANEAAAGARGTSVDAGAAVRWIALTADPIDEVALGRLRAAIATTADGAIVTFEGRTRETPGTPSPGQEAEAARHAGGRVLALEYEAYEGMAEAVIRAIADEIEARFGVRRIAVLHRTGTVPLGEPSVAIAVASAHRGVAFDACRYAIDQLKARAPIWKSEQFADGSVWIAEPPAPL